jgi:lysophospholipid acyltransferase (LPLAT)-like uncharacterized protein
VPEAASAIAARKSEERAFTLWQRIVLTLATWAGTLLIRAIAPTLRYAVSIEEGGPPSGNVRPAIYVFWHRCVIPATWWFRKRDIAVMTSQSFDGEYIARILEKFGCSAVRGSSSRGAVRALLGMHRVIDEGRTVAFTIDGPRGPRYVAKPGPVLLARNTGVPIMCFHIALDDPWVLPSWDLFMIPKPFSRALVRISRLIEVPADADSPALTRFHAELQATLDRARVFAEENLPSIR